MSVRIASSLSTAVDPRVGALEAAGEAARALDGADADVAFVFASGSHLAAPETTLEAVHQALSPAVLAGCGAGGVLGGRREIEGGSAVVVWAACLDGGRAEGFHAEIHELEEGMAVSGVPDLAGAGGMVLLPDPSSFPVDAVLTELSRRAPAVPVLGGLASARTIDGEPALFLGERVVGAGAVGVRLEGVELLPCVSQGAAPLGPELTVTAGRGHVIEELAGRPALETLRAVIEELPVAQRAVVSQGLLLGLVIESGKPDYEQGDFLVSGVMAGDPAAGTIAVGSTVTPGQIVRLHARDASSADRDLRGALGLRRSALGGGRPAGALVFTCNGRGRGMFGTADHDAQVLAEELGDVPAAGFFAAGEIGPVGGETFLHGFTATVAVFAA